jgi:hypothetical protein
MWQYLGLLLLPIQKEECKTFYPLSRIRISNRQAGASLMRIQSSRHAASYLCKHFLLGVLFGNVISYTISTQSDMSMYTYSSQGTDAGRAKEIKNWESNEGCSPRKSFLVPIWARVS